MPLVSNFVTFGPPVDPLQASYYANLTGFWRGDLQFHNLTNLTGEALAGAAPPIWLQDAQSFISTANLTNATELSTRLGEWDWVHSAKVAISFGDKLPWSNDDGKILSDDIAIIHVRVSLPRSWRCGILT